jgi:hypothetical protein
MFRYSIFLSIRYLMSIVQKAFFDIDCLLKKQEKIRLFLMIYLIKNIHLRNNPKQMYNVVLC